MDYNNFNDMDDLFRELMNGLGGFNSENRRYLINGRQVTPEEFAEYQKTASCQDKARPRISRASKRRPTAFWKS